jgi:hypothetical protein
MAAAAGVLVRYALTRYLNSRLYTGTGAQTVITSQPEPVPEKKPVRRRT